MSCRPSSQPLVLDLYSMCTKYSPHRLPIRCRRDGGNGAAVEAADHVPSDVESGGSVNAKAHFHLYDVSCFASACRHSRAMTLSAHPSSMALGFAVV